MDTRPITTDELATFHQVFRPTLGFGPPSEAELERDARTWDLSRSLATFDGDQMVGTTHSHLFDVTLPGGSGVSAAGVTGVATRTTHRRRGVLSGLMRRQLTEARDRGEAVALLLASEGAIYQRFGYGLATQTMSVEIDPRDSGGIAGTQAGIVTIVDLPPNDETFVRLHEVARRRRPGGIERPDGWWEAIASDHKPGEQTIAVHTPSGATEPDGYVRYKIEAKWGHGGIAEHKLSVRELVASEASGELALWRYVLSADLVKTVSAWGRPIDDPLRWWMANPRALRAKEVSDYLWARPLDVPALLGGRLYSTPIDLVIEVTDELELAGGRYRVKGDPADASCTRTDDPPSLRMPAAVLGAVLFGGISLGELAMAGRLDELEAGAVRTADAAFGWSPRPHGTVYF